MNSNVLYSLTIVVAHALPAAGQNIVAPKRGIPIPPKIRDQLEQRVSELRALAATIQKKHEGGDRQRLLRFLPDAEVFHASAERTLEDGIFFKKSEFALAASQLDEGPVGASETWLMEPAIVAFETFAAKCVPLSLREAASYDGLVHAVRQSGAVYGWELRSD